jgi:hypothetical protein
MTNLDPFPLSELAQSSILSRHEVKQGRQAMRLTIIAAVAAILTPAALTAHPVAPGLTNAPAATDFSAAKKKKAKKKTEQNMKAAPGAPSSEGKSTY